MEHHGEIAMNDDAIVDRTGKEKKAIEGPRMSRAASSIDAFQARKGEKERQKTIEVARANVDDKSDAKRKTNTSQRVQRKASK